MPTPDRAQRQRQAAHMLTRLLGEHPDLPVLDWHVSAEALYAHVYICDVDNPHGLNRDVFTAWTTTLSLTRPELPALFVVDDAHLQAHRVIDGVPVIITATVHPF
jgi:hypothetical protein